MENIEKIINGDAQNLSYEELIHDKAFEEYLSLKAKPLFDKYGITPIKIRMYFHEEGDRFELPGFCACINDQECIIEADDDYFKVKRPDGSVSIKDSVNVILGVLFHELGHAIYTDLYTQDDRLKNPKLETDIIKDKDHLEVINEILYKVNNDYKMAVTDEKGYYIETPLKDFISYTMHDFANIAEDEKVNRRLLAENEFTEFLNAFKAERDRSEASLIETDKKRSLFDAEAIKHGKCNEVERLGDFSYLLFRHTQNGNVPDKRLYPLSCEAMPVIDRMLEEEDQDKFFDLALELVAIAYPLFEDRILFKTEEEEEEYFRRQALKKKNK